MLGVVNNLHMLTTLEPALGSFWLILVLVAAIAGWSGRLCRVVWGLGVGGDSTNLCTHYVRSFPKANDRSLQRLQCEADSQFCKNTSEKIANYKISIKPFGKI